MGKKRVDLGTALVATWEAEMGPGWGSEGGEW